MNSNFPRLGFWRYNLRQGIVGGKARLLGLLLWLTSQAIWAQNNGLDHFSWSSIPTVMEVGQPVGVTLYAQDLQNNTVSGYDGSAYLSAEAYEDRPGVLITEVQNYAPRRVEFTNVSTNAVDVGDWKVVFYDVQSWPLPKNSFVIPAGTVCPPLGVFKIAEKGMPPGVFPNFFTGVGLNWSLQSFNNPIGVLLLDASGQAVDMFCAADAYPALINVPQTLSPELWSSAPVLVNSISLNTLQRVGHQNHGNLSDWSSVTNNIGLKNPGLQLPFPVVPTSLALTPSLVTFTNGIWSGSVIVNEAGSKVLLRADDGLGHAGDSPGIAVLGLPALGLSVPRGAFKATPGLTGTGSVTIPTTLTTNLPVILTSGALNSITLPPTITIPAGAVSQTFAVSNLDNGLIEGAFPVRVSAEAPGFDQATAYVTNYDAAPVSLSVALPAHVMEGSGWASGCTVTSSVPVDADCIVRLSSNHRNQILAPDFVIIRAGQNSAAFGVTVLDDPFLDASPMVTISASVPGWNPGSAQVLFLRNKLAALSVSVPAQLNEGSGVATNAGRVQMGGLLASNLLVTLNTDSPDRIQVPTNVIISAGQTSAVFSITVIDDNLTNGNKLAQIGASAAGLLSGTRAISIIDNDVASFSFGALPPAQVGGQVFPVTVSAINASGTTCPGYSTPASLAALGPSGTVSSSPGLTGPFTNGVWSGLVSVAGENAQVVLKASDSAGHVGFSTPFDVVSGTLMNLPVSDIAFDSVRHRLWAAIQSNGGTNSQSIISMDPLTGVQDASIPILGEPGKIAISDDAQFLYVGLTSSNGVVRVNLQSRTVDLRFALPPGGVTTVSEMAVPPRDPHALVVQMTGASAATAIYRDGIPRTNMIAPAGNVTEYHFAFYDSSTNFWCLYPGGLRQININDGGVTVVRETGDPQYGGASVYAGGLFFNSLGSVYEPRSFDHLANYPTNGLIAVDAAADEVLFLCGSQLNAFDLAAFSPIGQIDLPIVDGTATRMLLCGSNVLAVATAPTGLLLFQTALIHQPPPATLAITQVASSPVASVGSNFVYTLIVSNAGPSAFTNVWLIDQLPTDTTLISRTASAGSWQGTDALLSFNPGVLQPGAALTLQLTIVPQTPGQLVNSVWVVGNGVSASNPQLLTNPVVFGPVLPAVTLIRASSDALAYDSTRGLLWMTTERFNGALEQKLRSLSLSNGLAGPVFPLGYPSGKLAMSADQNYLYALYVNNQDGLNYTPDQFIKRANLTTGIIDEDFPVTDRVGQQEAAIDMIGIASYPSGILVSKGQVNVDVSIYQDGTMLLDSADGAGGGVLEINPSIPSRAYRLVGGYIEGNLARLQVGPSNLTLIDSTNLFAVAPFGPIPIVNQIKFAAGFLFGDNGIVVDPEAMQRVGLLPIAGLVESDPASGLVYYLVNNSPQWTLVAFDAASFAPLWAYDVPGVTGLPTDLVNCGSGRLAFRTSDEQIFLLNTAQIPHSLAADLVLTQDVPPSALVTNQQVTFTSRLINAGPGPATSVFITNQLPADIILISTSSSQGTFTNVSGTVVCSVGDLAPGASAWLQVVATLGRAGTLTNVATAASSTADPVSSNNVAITTVDYSIVPVSDLSVTHLPPVLGSNLVYTIIVSNAGPDTASGISLSDTIGLGGMLISATASQGRVTSFPNLAFSDLGDLTNGGTATMTLTVGPCCGGMVLNQVWVSSWSQDPNPYNNQSSSVVALSAVQFADEIHVPATEITYDPARQQILANLTESIGSVTQSVMSVDVGSGAINELVHVGNDLRRIALSDDSQFLYVGLADTGGVARINMSTRTVDLRFALNTPDAPFGPYVAEDLAVVPGNPTALAAARGGYAGYYSGIAIFDSGVQRPDTIEEGPGAGGYTIRFLDASNLCSMSEWDVQSSRLTATGLTNIVPVMSGYGGGLFEVDAGLAFTSFGKALDPQTGTEIATYAANGLAAPDLSHGRVYYLTFNSVLKAFDSATLSELWSVDLSGLSGTPQHLIRLGTNGLAFTTDANRMFIVKPSVLDTPLSDVALTQTVGPDPVNVGGQLTCTLTVVNNGPWTATGVIVSNVVPANTSFQTVSSSQGSCGLTNGVVICALGSLTNGQTATVTINLIPLTQGAISNSAVVTQNEYDPNPANGSATATVTAIPPPTLTVQDATGVQGYPFHSAITFPITLSRPSSIPVSFAYYTTNGTAMAPQDFDVVSGVFTIPAGSVSGSLRLTVIGTAPSVLPLETFYLAIPAVTNATLTRTQAMGTIVVQVHYSISMTGPKLAAGTSAFTNALFQLTLNQTSSVPVSVQYQTIDGSAFAGFDYQAKSGQLVFAPGTANLTLAVPVYGNPVWQPTKTFSVLLFDPENAILTTDEAAGTILTSDPLPPLVILVPPVTQVVSPPADALFAVSATGYPPPLTYQWSFQGTNLPGATRSSYLVPNVQPQNAGIYSVHIANGSGVSTNASAALIVLEGLNYDVVGNDVILTWSGPYILQSATNSAGPYTDIPGSTSPTTNSLSADSALFFRLKSLLTN